VKKILLWIAIAAALTAAGVLSGRGGDARNGHTASAEAFEAYKRGNEQLISFQLQNAEASLRRAIELDPGFALAHAALSELLMIRRVDGEAKREVVIADSLAALIPGDLERLQVQVRLSGRAKSRNRDVADSLLAAGQALDPNELIFLVVEATRADANNDPQAAERIWNRVLKVDPNFAEAYNRLGYLYLNQGRYDEAEAAMRKYAFVAPDLANPHDSLGEVLMNVGRYEEAEAEFANALAKQPDDFPWSQVNIGKIYLRRGQITKGMKLLTDLRQVLRGTGWERNIALLTINALFEHGLVDQLDEHTLQFVQSFPKDENTPFLRALRMIYHGDVAGARAVMDSTTAALRKESYYADFESVRREIDMGRARFDAFAAAETGDPAAAANHFRKVLTIGAGAPPHQVIFDRYKLAEQLHKLGQDDEAMREIDKVLTVNPRTTEALALATEINLKAGNRAAALRNLEMLERSLTVADPNLPILEKARQLRAQFSGESGGI
jgi:tetratricopeptide (TPR) repeat protein